MVQIVNSRVIYLIYAVFIISICSCNILRNNNCELVSQSNEIRGNDKNAKTIEVEKLYIIPLISDLYQIPRETLLNASSRGYYNTLPTVFTGYKISGCRDTTAAKLRMAEHLCKKYGYYRKDSVYLDTIYRIELLDRSKLPMQNDDCNKNIFTMKRVGTERYSTQPCVEWDAFFINIVSRLCHRRHCYPLEIPEGEGKLDITTPIKARVEHDVEKLTAYYEEQWGVRITQERIDSVDVVLIKKIPDG